MEQANILISLQEDRIEQIHKAKSNYLKTPKSRITLSYVETRLETLERLYSSFIKGHEEISTLILRGQRSSVDYFSLDKFNELDELYTIYKTSLKHRLMELNEEMKTSNALSPRTSTSTEIKLPAIQIPTFAGSYTDWPSFRDLFTSIVHKNTTLDDVQKLHYLKSLVAGEAEQLLRNFTITNDNYMKAWETLYNRFDNKRYIANSIFKKLFSLKTITQESACLLKQLLYITLDCLNSFKNIGINTDAWDDIIVYLTVSKLDSVSHRLWEQHISADSGNMPTFQQLHRFLEMRFKSLEMVEDYSKQGTSKTKTFHSSVSTASSVPCTFCDGVHYIFQCKQFVRLSLEQRKDFVKENNLCFNCLIPYHSVQKCLKGTRCNICKGKHHSLLHPRKKETTKEQPGEEIHTQGSENIITHFLKQPGQVLLATALVDVSQKSGYTQVYRALIDQGSQASFVTEDVVKSAGLKKIKTNGEVTGLSEGSKLRTKYVVMLKLRSRTNPHFTVAVKAYVLKNITHNLPLQGCNVPDWPELHSIKLADPTFNEPNKIDILLGAEAYTQIIDDGLLRSSAGTIAQNTKLGWILSGKILESLPGPSTTASKTHKFNPDSLQLLEFQQTTNRKQINNKSVITGTPWWAAKNRVLGGRNVGVVFTPP